MNHLQGSAQTNKAVKKLITNHAKLVHTENIKVISHVQREVDDWSLNTLMLEGVGVPFKYKRKKTLQKPKRAKG
jgi:hypothetical protein